MLLLVFLISIAILLLCIIKIKLNPFVALLVCAYGTGLMATEINFWYKHSKYTDGRTTWCCKSPF